LANPSARIIKNGRKSRSGHDGASAAAINGRARRSVPGKEPSSASIIISARSRCRTSWRCASPRACSNPVMEQRPYRPRADHRRRDTRRRRARRLLRGRIRRCARHVQNHMLQLLCLVAMAAAFRLQGRRACCDEKLKGEIAGANQRRANVSHLTVRAPVPRRLTEGSQADSYHARHRQGGERTT